MIRFWDKVNIQKDKNICWHWTGALSGNYGMFWFEGRMILAHRMSYALYHNRLDIINHFKNYHKDNNNFDCILHNCDNTKCCNPHHLYVSSNKKNIEDKVKRGRTQKMVGILNGRSKITEQDVLNIRLSYIPRMNGGLSAIATKYKVSLLLMCMI